MLSWGALFGSYARLVYYSARVALHRKLPFMAAGVACYYAALYALAVFRPSEGFAPGQALYVLVDIPGAVLAVYLCMDQVAGERERNTLETLYSTAMSHYGVWLARLGAVYGALALSLFIMSGLAYVLFAEFPFVVGGLNAWVPAFFVCNLTFFFAVFSRSSNTAGMLSLGVVVAVLLSSSSLKGGLYFLFLNPFDPPLGSDISLWNETVFFNRGGILVLGLLLFSGGLRRMRQREKLLG